MRDGVWRMIRGRRVFIRKGQSLTDAMKQSGKFFTNKNNLIFTDEKINEYSKGYYEKFHKDDSIKPPTKVKITEKDIDKEWANELNKDFEELSKEYYNNIISIDYKIDISNPKMGGYQQTLGAGNYSQLTICNNTLDKQKAIESMKKDIFNGYHPKINEENIPKAVMTHEFAHALVSSENKYQKKAFREIMEVKRKYVNELNELDREYSETMNKFFFNPNDTKLWEKAKRLTDKKDEIFISDYIFKSSESDDEFIAEAFSMAKLSSNPSPYAQETLNIINKYYKRKW